VLLLNNLLLRSGWATDVGSDDARARVQVVVRLESADVSERTADVHDDDDWARESKGSEGAAT